MALQFLNNGYFAGNVGIGTTTPAATLDIQANFAVNGGYTSSGWAKYIILDAANTGGGGIIWSKQTGTYNRGLLNNQGKFEIGRSTADDDSANWLGDLVIDASGNVGIGNTTPQANLVISNAGGGTGGVNLEILPVSGSVIQSYLDRSADPVVYIKNEQRALTHEWDINTTNKMILNATGLLTQNRMTAGTGFYGDGKYLDNVFSLGVYSTTPGTAGVLIKTNIISTNYGFIFGTLNLEQFNFTSIQRIQFSATVASNGTVVSKAATADIAVTIKLFRYNGFWYIHVPTSSTYITVTAFINTGSGYQGQAKGFNEVDTIVVGAVPSGAAASVDIVADVYVTTGSAGGPGPFLPLTAGSTKKLTDTLYIEGTNSTNAESVLLRGVTANDGDWLGSIRTANAGGYDQEMRFYTSDADGITNENLVLTLSADQSATFAGKVNIQGTAPITPNANFNDLVITDSGNAGISIFSGIANDGAIYFGDADANNMGQIKYLHGTNTMTFTTDNDNPTLILDDGYNVNIPSGKLGIGMTTAPTYDLDIHNNNGRIRVLGSTGYAAIELQNSGNGFYLARNGTVVDSFATGNTAYAGIIAVQGNYNLEFGTNGIVRQTIDGAGSVGIGVASPKSKLQVAGGIQMGDDAASPSVDKIGTMRYRVGTEYVEDTGRELITDGDFSSSTYWLGANVVVASGVATFTGTTGFESTLSQQNVAIVTTAGTPHALTYTVVSNSLQGTASFYAGFKTNNECIQEGLIPMTVGTHTVYGNSVGTGNGFSLHTSVGFTSGTLVIDNVSVKAVTLEDASYADMCMQTGSSTYEWVNIVRNTY